MEIDDFLYAILSFYSSDDDHGTQLNNYGYKPKPNQDRPFKRLQNTVS